MIPISISNDWTIVLLPLPLSVHSYTGPAGYVPFGAAFDSPVPMYWPPGFALGSNKLTKTVLHKGLPVVLEGHDCGVCIPHPHVLPDPLNAQSVVHTLFSSRKVNFFTSKDVAEGKCVGIAKIFAFPPAPMTSCGEPVSAPGTGVPTTALNNVFVDLPWVDALIGWGAVVADMVIDTVMAFESGAFAGGGAAPKFKDAMAARFGLTPEAALKQGLAVTTGVVRMAATDGPADIKVGVGAPYFKVEVGVSRSPDGDLSGMVGGNLLNTSVEVGQDQDSFYYKQEQRGFDEVSTTERRFDAPPVDDSHALEAKIGSWGAPL